MPYDYLLKKDKNEAIFYKYNPIRYFQFHKCLKQLLLTKCYLLSSFQLLLLFPCQNGLGRKWQLSEREVNARKLSKLHKNFVEVKKLPDHILSELELIRYKKPVDKPKYSVNMSRYALILRYTSVQASKRLLQQFPLPSLSILKTLLKRELSYLKQPKVYWNKEKLALMFCCLTRFIYKKIRNTKMGNLLVLTTKKMCTKVLWHSW